MDARYHAGFYGYDIYIPESVWETAREWEATIMATGLNKRRNYTGLEKETRYIDGYIGELSVCNALAIFNRRYAYKPQLTGRSDRSGRDIMVWGNSGRKIAINVKTAGEAYLRHMRVPEAQVKLYHPDIYVGGQILGHHWFGLHGWIWHREFVKKERIMERCQTVRCLFSELHHIDELLNNIQDNEGSDAH